MDRVSNITHHYLERKLRYSYTPRGYRHSFTVEDLRNGEEKETSYLWTNNGQLAQINPWSGGSVSYSYRLDGLRQTASLSEKLQLTYGYDSLNRTTELSYSGAEAPLAYRYQFDLVGNILEMQDDEGTTSYGYDLLDRLTNVEYQDGTWETFEFDAASNRIRHSDQNGSTDYVIDDANRVISTHGASNESYTYDANGCRTSKTSSAGTFQYTWDATGRLSSVVLADSSELAYKYNPLSSELLSYTKNDGEEIRLLWDDGDVAQELTSSNDCIADYIRNHTSFDEHIARVEDNQRHTYIRDFQGSVRKVIDQAGVFRNSYSYKAFGELRALSENVSNPYRFTGRRWLAGQEEYYYRARFMAPGLGGFTSPDVYSPIEQPRYVYCINNPISIFDPEGKDAFYRVKTGQYWESPGSKDPFSENKTHKMSGGISGGGEDMEEKYINEPEMENVKNKGPVPEGRYERQIPPEYSKFHRDRRKEPQVAWQLYEADDETIEHVEDDCKRDLHTFYEHTGSFTKGCIIWEPAKRDNIIGSNEIYLQVLGTEYEKELKERMDRAMYGGYSTRH